MKKTWWNFLNKCGVKQKLNKGTVNELKHQACNELFKENIKEHILETLSHEDAFLEHGVWVATFDNIEEFFSGEEHDDEEND